MGTLGDDFWDDEDVGQGAAPADHPLGGTVERSGRPVGHRFDAPLRVCELDDRLRASPPWRARGVELSRSHLVFRSRRMVYEGRLVIVVIDLIDDHPTVVCGRVVSCEYDEEGMHRIDVDFIEMPPGVSAAKVTRRSQRA